MQLANSIKRAPKWAWFTVIGVGAGAVGIKVWKDRAAPVATSGDPGTQVGDPTYGTPGVSSSPTPVITPPVIIGGTDGGDGGALSEFVSILGNNFDTLVTGITGLAGGDQALAGQGMSGITDIATAAIANAGSPPAPLSQNPTPIIVNVPTPVGAAPSVPPKGKPCCKYEGKPLSWWRNPANAKKGGKWNWPHDSHGFYHSSAFAGNAACDGGGNAPGSHKEC